MSATASMTVPWWKDLPRNDGRPGSLRGCGGRSTAFDFTVFLLIMVPIDEEFDVPLVAVRQSSP